MPLSPPAPREHLHTRSIVCRGYRREDGLFDIEGHLTDVKSYAFPNRYRGAVAAGEPLHDMWVRLTIDRDLLIHAAEACTAAGPYAVCGEVNAAYGALAGVRIGPGWRRQVQQRVGGVDGCTHLTEVLWTMATTAYQTIHGRRAEHTASEKQAGQPRPFFIDSCHALSRHGEVVRQEWPQWYEAAETQPGAGDGDVNTTTETPMHNQSDAPMATPCLGICRIDEGSGLCVGCGRSLDEICNWLNLGEDERAAIIRRCECSQGTATADETLARTTG